MKIPLRTGHIPEDLCLQSLSRRPLHFAAKAEQEFKIERCFIGKIDGLKVQNVRLHAEPNALKCGPIADIGHGFKTSVADGDAA